MGMKYDIITLGVMLVLLVGLTSCSTDDPLPVSPETELPIPPVSSDEPDNNNTDNDNQMGNHFKISIGSTSFAVTLEDNVAAMAFKALLPMTVDMAELNGNEKYYYLSGSLPVASSNPGTIRSGDLMLYGTSCIVLFYKNFSTSYSYTPLGRVDNPSELISALGSGSATVTFELL